MSRRSRVADSSQQSRVNELSLVFRDVCVRVNDKAVLKSVNGFVNSGEMLALIGASGCGKVCVCICSIKVRLQRTRH
jgi:ABC-type transporter Mla maintaining outer membrane lipid asymmetry ATPase subunit MlaF